VAASGVSSPVPKIGDEMDFNERYRVMETRDESFAGQFFAAVTSTGIYCRPGCTARMPKRENVRFYRTAAAARSDGFRACLRCHPDQYA
jgi:AraC family transcriptional regulator of adaptative response / DNA-3-methyladenine glycosylase II